MHFDVALALVVFCFVASVTPGPNNMMLLSSAVNFGVRRTLPHLLGVVLGVSAMVGLVGFGLDALFDRFPSLLPLMRWAGAAYLLWLAWRVANAGPAHEAAAEGRPLGFFAAAAFQWINPKAWVAGIGALTAYSVSDLGDRRDAGLRRNGDSIRIELGVVRRGHAPRAQRSRSRSALQLDDGCAARRIGGADLLGIGVRA